jgi:hypothetical protein
MIGIKEEVAFDRMPLQSDDLMDAGCEVEEILGHCRSDRRHIRESWVVDLLPRRGQKDKPPTGTPVGPPDFSGRLDN